MKKPREEKGREGRGTEAQVLREEEEVVVKRTKRSIESVRKGTKSKAKEAVKRKPGKKRPESSAPRREKPKMTPEEKRFKKLGISRKILARIEVSESGTVYKSQSGESYPIIISNDKPIVKVDPPFEANKRGFVAFVELTKETGLNELENQLEESEKRIRRNNESLGIIEKENPELFKRIRCHSDARMEYKLDNKTYEIVFFKAMSPTDGKVLTTLAIILDSSCGPYTTSHTSSVETIDNGIRNLLSKKLQKPEEAKAVEFRSLSELISLLKSAETEEAKIKVLEEMKLGFLQAGFKQETVGGLVLFNESESGIGYKDNEGKIYPVKLHDNFSWLNIIISFEKEILPYYLRLNSQFNPEAKINDVKKTYEAALKLKEKLGDRLEIYSLFSLRYFYNSQQLGMYIKTDHSHFYVSLNIKESVYYTPVLDIATATPEQIDAELEKLISAAELDAQVQAAAAAGEPPAGAELSLLEKIKSPEEADRFKEVLLASNFNDAFVMGLEFDGTSPIGLSYTSEKTGKRFGVSYFKAFTDENGKLRVGFLEILKRFKWMEVMQNTTPEDVDNYYRTRWEKIKGFFSRRKATPPEGPTKADSTAPSQEEAAAAPAAEAVAPADAAAAPETKPLVTPAKETKPPPILPPQVIADGIVETPTDAERTFFGGQGEREPTPGQPPSAEADVDRQGFGKPVDEEKLDDDLPYTPTGRITDWVRNHVGLILCGIVIVSSAVAAYAYRDQWQIPVGGKTYECGLKRVSDWPPKLSAICTNPKGKIEGKLAMVKTPDTADCEWQDADGNGVRDRILSCRAQLGLEDSTGKITEKTKLISFEVPQEKGKADHPVLVRFK